MPWSADVRPCGVSLDQLVGDRVEVLAEQRHHGRRAARSRFPVEQSPAIDGGIAVMDGGHPWFPSGSALRGWPSLVLDAESQFCEYGNGAVLAALEIAGGKPLAGGELVGGAQDCFRWVPTFAGDQVISAVWAVSMLSDECFRSQTIVCLDRPLHLSRGDGVRHHMYLRVLPGEASCRRPGRRRR